jgi:hypothetical protein
MAVGAGAEAGNPTSEPTVVGVVLDDANGAAGVMLAGAGVLDGVA